MAEIREFKRETEKSSPKVPKAKRASKTLKTETAVPNGSFAIIETGGKQYRVVVGDTIKIEKLNGEIKEGDAVVFDKVLLIDNGTDSTDIGTPYINGAKVSGTLVEIGRNAKIIVIKYKQKSRYFKRNGHRQPYFKVKIDKIG
jgi:large subunit ribosomal protein L21